MGPNLLMRLPLRLCLNGSDDARECLFEEIGLVAGWKRCIGMMLGGVNWFNPVATLGQRAATATSTVKLARRLKRAWRSQIDLENSPSKFSCSMIPTVSRDIPNDDVWGLDVWSEVLDLAYWLLLGKMDIQLYNPFIIPT